MDMQLSAVTVTLDGSKVSLERVRERGLVQLNVSVVRKGRTVLERQFDVSTPVYAWESAKVVIAAAQGVSYEKRIATNSEVQDVADLLQRVGA